MAIIVCRGLDNTNPDPTINETVCYKRGDVVAVWEDGHQRGSAEAPPAFYFVHVPGVAAVDVADYAVQDEAIPVRSVRKFIRHLLPLLRSAHDDDSQIVQRARRAFKFDIGALSFDGNGDATVALSNIIRKPRSF